MKRSRNLYTTLVVDEMTGYRWVYGHACKKQIATHIKYFVKVDAREAAHRLNSPEVAPDAPIVYFHR